MPSGAGSISGETTYGALLRKNSDRGVVGLDIDSRYLAAAQVDGGRLVRAASLELQDGVVRDGEVVDPDALAAALKSFIADAGLPRACGCVANQQIVVRVVELPRIEDVKQRDAAVRFQAAEAIAMPLDEAVLITGWRAIPRRPTAARACRWSSWLPAARWSTGCWRP